jgi:hypothetical protein
MKEEQRFILLHKSNPAAWALMPHAIERIKKFCVEYGTDLDPERMGKLVEQHFISDNPLLLVIVGYRRDVGVFCHAVGSIDDVLGKKFLTILQFESDMAFTDRTQVDSMWQEFAKFGLKHGAAEAQLVTSNERMVKLFSKYYGFKQHRYLMRQSLKEGQ